jgi:adenylate cyclase
MEADEAGTLETLRRYRTAIARLVERHDGRIVNTWGDAVIAEFASVVEAVQCAVEIQQEISNQDSGPPPPMRFRIGINLGDVMVDGSDLYGDGVNIAARLQELAEPGGIVISSSAYDQVHNKLSVGFDCLGQRPMKNIAPRDQLSCDHERPSRSSTELSAWRTPDISDRKCGLAN